MSDVFKEYLVPALLCLAVLYTALGIYSFLKTFKDPPK